jgi:hypothetical protein
MMGGDGVSCGWRTVSGRHGLVEQDRALLSCRRVLSARRDATIEHRQSVATCAGHRLSRWDEYEGTRLDDSLGARSRVQDQPEPVHA